MKNYGRSLLALALTVCGLALGWGGFGQAFPDSGYLYAAGIVLLINAIGLMQGKSWVRKTWVLTTAGAALFAVYYTSLIFRHSYYGPASARNLPMFLFGLAPLVAAGIISYFLPKLIAHRD